MTDREMQRQRVARWTLYLWALAASLGFAVDALASEPVKLPSEATLKVIYRAAKRYDVDAQHLIKIAFLESSFREDARRANPNGTIDLGMFQVNSIHWTTTCKRFDVFTLKGNALCAAKLLRLAGKHADTDPHWIGRYHSRTPSRKEAYAAKLAAVTFEELP